MYRLKHTVPINSAYLLEVSSAAHARTGVNSSRRVIMTKSLERNRFPMGFPPPGVGVKRVNVQIQISEFRKLQIVS